MKKNGGNTKMKKVLIAALVCGSAVSLSACGDGATGLKFNLAYDNASRTMTYNFTSPLELPDKSAVTYGNLKPVWSNISKTLEIDFTDVTTQGQSAADMISVQAATDFANANIFGGNGVAEQLMNYGEQGKFVNLNDYMDQLPNFRAYLDENPHIEESITTVKGGIYHIPYVSEEGEIARTYNMRTNWVELLLDSSSFSYNTTNASAQTAHSQPFYGTGNPGGVRPLSSNPIGNVHISKKDSSNIIQMQNELNNPTGATLANQLKAYIVDQYGSQYENPSELYVGAKAAYDIDELVALFRVVKANGANLSSNASAVDQTNTVWPFFVRQSSYREDLLRFATYYDGARVYGSDSYSSRWEFDADGQIQYTYNKEETYDVLTYLSAMYAEGLIYSESLDTTNSGNFRGTLYGTDDVGTSEVGFMSFDWIASSTADSLNANVEVVLPPVANVNGSWQYYVDNSRTVKPDGWAISTKGSSKAQIDEALIVFDYMFSEEGSKIQNYGMDSLLSDQTGTYEDGTTYPIFNEWVNTNCDNLAEGDLSVFLRDYIGALMPIGFQKEIGFEYQYTSERGIAGTNMINSSTVNFPTAEGTGLFATGSNPNYYKLVPVVFSMTTIQQNNATLYTPAEEFFDLLFNIIEYHAAGGAPSTIVVPTTFSGYTAQFEAIAIGNYISTYQSAYTNMLATKKES